MLFFTNTGRVYRLKVWKLPEGGPQTKGRPMVNLLPLGDDERVTNVLPLPEDESEWSALNIVFATEQGMVRRNSMDAFTNVPSNGKYAMGFVEGSGDRLIGVRPAARRSGNLPRIRCRQGHPLLRHRRARNQEPDGHRGARDEAGKDGEKVVSMAVLVTGERDTEVRDAYLRAADWKNNERAMAKRPSTPQRSRK